MNPICFYHESDLDGVCSAAIVKYFVPECELYGIDYGKEFPWMKTVPDVDIDVDCSSPAEFRAKILTALVRKEEKRTVYMVDFSLPIEDMERLAEISNLIWIDHHRTAIDAFENGMPCVGNWLARTDFAACELTWFFFASHENADLSRGSWESFTFNPEISPEAVRLLGRYDVWDKDNPEWESKILPFQYGCRSLDNIYDPTSFDWRFMFDVQCPDTKPLVAMFVDNIIEVGAGILRYQAEVNRRACEDGAHEVRILSPRGAALLSERKAELEKHGPCPEDKEAVLEWFGYTAPLEHDIKWLEARTPEALRDRGVEPYVLRGIACNTTTNNSQFFDSVYDPEKHDLMVAFARVSNVRWFRENEQGYPQRAYPWKVSIYSTKPEIDCGAIAKSFGGGGHKGAAGFICDRLPWD